MNFVVNLPDGKVKFFLQNSNQKLIYSPSDRNFYSAYLFLLSNSQKAALKKLRPPLPTPYPPPPLKNRYTLQAVGNDTKKG